MSLARQFLSLPSRFYERITAIDGLLNQREELLAQNELVEYNPNSLYTRHGEPHTPGLAPLPGPWGFLTSGYAIGLVIMAILLNRIQNIVVPPRRLFTYALARGSGSRPTRSFLLSLYYLILPLDFSSTSTRLILRIPTLYATIRMLLIWTIILLQTSNFYPYWGHFLQSVGDQVSQMETSSVCWSTFCAVCGALAVGALTRGLDGTGTSANNAPFNMFSYSFLLHIYSAPLTHTQKAKDLPSRPDKHVVATIILPLLQLTMTHVFGINKRWSTYRLIPTGITCIIGLLHFHSVIWLYPSSYPLLNYMPALFESTLVFITLLTVSLNALTQILLEGSITRPLFGHASTLPKWDEDFSIALLRLGTASLEATSVAGLGNEVGGVSVPPPRTTKPRGPQVEYGTVEMNRFGINAITPTTVMVGSRQRIKIGFRNEIKNVKVSILDTEVWMDTTWYRELLRLGATLLKCGRGLWRLMIESITGRRQQHAREHAHHSEPPSEPRTPPIDDHDRQVYEQFLRGDPLSDDDEDFEPSGVSRAESVFSDADSSASDSGEEDAAEMSTLYADLSSDNPPSAPLLLAHMVDEANCPLTRQRYQELFESSDIAPRVQPSSSGVQGSPNPRHNCVICTVEPREIICWPCRCLSLCDDCRENLASRSSASKHRCPCCRRAVDGYSRIFIP